ncbi:MAG: hypothetical protein LRY59_00590 [Bacteroides graminisolvens]|nr:hypothetical protein [Bacteroides graminisolvens]
MLSIIDGGGYIRSSGLNNDPANIGIFAVIMSFYAVYKRNILLWIISFLSGIASVSFIAILGTISAVLYYCIILLRSPKHIFILAIVTGLTFYALNNINSPVFNIMKNAVTLRAESKQNSTMGDEKRGAYFSNFPLAVLYMPSSLIIGTGYSTASFS